MKFTSPLSLAKSLGVEYVDEVYQGKNAQYTSDKFLQEAVQAIASVIQSSISAGLQQSPFFSLMVDESTDIAVNKDLIMYVKDLDRTNAVQISFAGVTQLANGEAATIFNAVVQHF